jgi:hypothetical protein
LENIAGDLENHPRRAMIYFSCSLTRGIIMLASEYGRYGYRRITAE